MSQPVVQSFITTFDGSGTSAMSRALKGANQDLTNTQVVAEATGRSLDLMGGRSERIAASFVFRQMALDATGAAAAVKSTTSATDAAFVGLELLGRAGLAFAGEIGLAVLGVVAFIEIIAKLGGKSKDTAENIKEQTTALINNSIAASDSAKTLQKLGVIGQSTYDALIKSSSEAHAQALQKIKEVAAETGQKIDELNKVKRDFQTLNSLSAISEDKLTDAQKKNRDLVADEIKHYVGLGYTAGTVDEQLKKLTATQDAANKILDQKQKNIDTDAAIKLNQILVEQGVRKDVQAHNEIDLLHAQKTAQDELTDAETAYIAALKTGDKDVIDSAAKRVDATKAMVSSIKAGLEQLSTADKKVANDIKKGADDIASGWEMQNGRLEFSTKKAASAIVKTTADQIETQLAMAAARDFATGNVGAAIAETAAVAVVANLAGAAGALLGGDTSSGSAASSPSSASTASSSSNSSNGNMTSLFVKIEGGYFDSTAADNLAKILSQRVQQGNTRLVSSTVAPNFGQQP